MKRSGTKPQGESGSQQVSERIADFGGWRADMLGRIRALIFEAEPDVVEELKWRGTPVWSYGGMICTGEAYKDVVKMTFAKGAFVEDPSGLFNSSLEGNLRRAIDIHEGEEINTTALTALIRAAITLNVAGGKAAPTKASPRTSSATKAPAAKTSPKKASAKKAPAKKASPKKASAAKATTKTSAKRKAR
jgi:hypothetical protein